MLILVSGCMQYGTEGTARLITNPELLAAALRNGAERLAAEEPAIGYSVQRGSKLARFFQGCCLPLLVANQLKTAVKT
jgi:hypothetical protein